MDHFESDDPFTLLLEKDALEHLTGARCLVVRSRYRANSDMLFFSFRGLQVSVTTTKRDNQLIIHAIDVDVEEERGNCYGSKVLQALLAIAKKHHLPILAREVLKPSEGFWKKNGFTKCPPPNHDNDYVFLSPAD
ncbi:MAG TPA: hypothetical protein VJK53_01185 [Candidatus Paceibacterota bacterium]